ncbi:SDR family NAD(P)-dependent oxidoreductase [Williamsia deligens]|uniref:SDR family NAD(P)-dependent oxidoreductase n=1 Tax=Williamsia deligens TaxID=321325 RepID=A0ABW3G8T4_9NOCA|nr:SDR family oxidoreductase [Williamsia deligens]MCP2192643.1 NAD(P)-dependent dehydrogenase, short-chain alcohol dehydrogenase family [Williamsia deligens]
MTSYDLTGRKALVTGAAQGLGAGMASALAQAGAAVAVADINDELGHETVDSLRSAGAKAEFVHLDVRHDAEWESAMATAVAALGGIDIVVNNAGVEVTDLLIDFDADAASTLLSVNVLGTALSAIDRLTRVAAAESGKLGYGVRINCIYPGLTPTAMGNKLAVETAGLGLFDSPEAAAGAVAELTPLGRLGQVDDMADAVVFLSSDAAKFITGAGLPVDGGMGM